MAQSRQYELILFGATGYTGKLTAEWISQHLPTDLKWAIAGRNTKKLQDVVEDLKKLSPDRKQPDIETCELKEDQLTPLVLKTRLVITTIGPFMFHGEPLLSACAHTGTHYIDSTGEVPWLHSLLPKYHPLARSTGAILIPQCGLDSVPADLLSYALTTHIRRTLNAGTASLTMSYVDGASGVSGGTSETILQLFEYYGARKLGEALSPWSLSPVRPRNPSRGENGGWLRFLGLRNIPELGGLQTSWLMAGVDRCIVHRSWALYEQRAASTNNPTLSYGPRFSFKEYMRASSLLSALAINLAMASFGLLFAIPLTRYLLKPLVKRFIVPAPGDGPSRESMKNDYMSYKAVGVADTEAGERVVGRLRIPNGAYVATAQTMCAAAMVILRGGVGETEAGRGGGGMVTPAMLGGEMVERLGEYGIEIEVGV